ncbi:tetratricopeptide repeat protein [Aurantibacillus circumpalustris]|uniref:tetratricopeptide repeat protein n=1 Tax=Aurantibacillus circumpalustris TaxID=3036359 RepID=UPI00295AB69E|nr:tetratricopeptide repeat protein [Aurantibacillus circumpalustris]
MRFAIFLLLTFNVALAQQSDTVLARILALKNDTVKVNQLYKQGFSLRNSDPKLAFYYANLCEERAHISGSKKHLAKSYNLLGVLFYKKGDYTKALAYHQKALSIRTEVKDNFGAALSQTNLGNIYTDLQLFERAENSYLAALAIYRENGDEKRAADCLINLGVLKQTLKQNEAAFENYVHALKLAEKLNDYEMRSLCLNNMAQVFYDKGNYEKSIAYNEDALKIRNLMENNLEVADSYLNLAANYIRVKDNQKALEYLDTAYAIGTHYQYYEALQTAFNSYSEYYFQLKNYEQAYYWLRKYQQSKDSVMLEQSAREAEFDFNLPEIIGQSPVKKREIHNLWLLISVMVFLIFIPFIFIRFKR